MSKSHIRTVYAVCCGICILLLAVVTPEFYWRYLYNKTIGRFFRHSVESRLQSFGRAAEKRLQLRRELTQLVIIALKSEKRLELWGIDPAQKRFFIAAHPILAASGQTGPKLQEGDLQVPEGFYNIESFHPNSHFYLALKIAYPSPEDITAAISEKRDPNQLGSHIMLHGEGGSAGCISVENQLMEDIFYLGAAVGADNIKLLILPWDFRTTPPPSTSHPWLAKRYQRLAEEMKYYKKPR